MSSSGAGMGSSYQDCTITNNQLCRQNIQLLAQLTKVTGCGCPSVPREKQRDRMSGRFFQNNRARVTWPTEWSVVTHNFYRVSVHRESRRLPRSIVNLSSLNIRRGDHSAREPGRSPNLHNAHVGLWRSNRGWIKSRQSFSRQTESLFQLNQAGIG